MADQVLVWTPIPAGTDGVTARLSIVVSPRLTPGPAETPVLGSFPDFADWPALIGGATWTVQVTGGPALIATADISPLDSGLWRALFSPDVPVVPYGFTDRRGAIVVSYPVRRMLTSLRSAYGQVAVTSPDAPPPPSRLVGTGSGDGLLTNFAVPWDASTEAVARRQLGDRGDLSGPGITARFLLFHHQPPPNPFRDLENDPPLFTDLVDFHRAVASVASYSPVLRALGLLIDLTVPVAELPASGVLQIMPSIAADTDIRPGTRFRADAAGFTAVPDPGAGGGDPLLRDGVADGYLQLDPAMFTLTEVDVDGGGLKAQHLATGLVALAATGSPPPRAGLPTLRSGGFTLARDERAYLLGELFNRAGKLQDTLPGPPILFLDDILRGVRVDVWDNVSGTWHSLMQRTGVYAFTDVAGTTITRRFTDEGTVEPTTSSPNPPTGAPLPGPDQWMHEALFRWDGWSLAAPRPGTPINRSADPDKATDPDPSAGAPVTAFRLATEFTPVPESLPRLRFGRRYRVRARAVDLAGNSAPLADSVDMHALPKSGSAPYRRFEPVAAPLVILRAALPLASAGETLTRLVLRSANTDPSLDGSVLAVPTDRHITPPRASVHLAETHGVLDDPVNGRLRVNPATYAELAARDAAELTEDTTTPPVRPEPQLAVMYLPDPLSRGAALRLLPGQPVDTRAFATATGPVTVGSWPLSFPGEDLNIPPDTVTLIDFEAERWPDPRPFRLVVVDGDGLPEWDAAARTLTVGLPKAATASIGLSSYVEAVDLGLLGVWALIRETIENLPNLFAGDTSEAGELEVATVITQVLARRAVSGGHWMLTPSIDLTLLHAVQQPIGRPRFAALFATRQAEAPSAQLTGVVDVHAASTVRIDVTARWSEPVDDPTVPAGFRTQIGTAPVDEIRLDDITAAGPVTAGGSPPRTVGRYDPVTDTVQFDAQVGSGLEHHLGDTKHRTVHYRAIATSRFREYFADQTLDFTRASDDFRVDVPASARPHAPKVRHVVPTFGWQRDTTTTLLSSVRRGGGLRVWLDPPWFSSGEGELLGVVVFPSDAPSPSDDERLALRPYITQWGVDPLWPSGPVADMPTLQTFLGPVVAGHDLLLPELPGVFLAVSGLPVSFDPGCQRWYADVVLSAPGAYTPFVRLALARYQPSAIDGAALSPVVVADCCQLAPDRSLLATYDPLCPETVTVTVSGTTYQLPELGIPLPPPNPQVRPPRGTVEVEVQQRLSDVDDDELGWARAPAGLVTVTQEQPPALADDTLLWHGTITLPPDRPRGLFRLVVAESEWLVADPPNRGPGLGFARPRIVYTDRLPL